MREEGWVNRIDLEQNEKVVRRLVDSVEGRAAIESVLGVRFAHPDRKTSDKPIVALLIPSHKSPCPETVEAYGRMIAETGDAATIIQRPSIASSVVSWVRNQLLAKLYEDGTPFTHVLFMDDDIVPPANALAKLLEHKVDIVAAACTVRQDPPLPNFRAFNEKDFTFITAFQWNGDGLLKIGGVGTGLMLISKKALDAVAEYTVSWKYFQKYLGMSEEVAKRVEAGSRKKYAEKFDAGWFEMLKHPLGDGEYGEDLSFCVKARECGFDVFVDTSVRPGHVGSYAYSLEDFFHYQGALLAEHAKKNDDIVVVE